MSAKAPTTPQNKHQGGFTPMPHSYFTILGRKTTGYAQFFAIGYIIDRTLGVPDKPTWTKLSGTTLARLTGLDSTSFHLAIEDAVARGLVERRKQTCDGTCAFNACTCAGRDWVYRALPDRWATASDWERKKIAKVEEPAPVEQDQQVDPKTAPHRGDTLLVLPGKHSQPMLLSLAIKGVAEPVPMQLRYRNEVEQPFNVNASVKGDIITVTVRKGEADGRTNSEASLSPLSNQAGTTKRSNGDGLLSPLSNRQDQNEANQRFRDFKSYLNISCLQHFRKAADDALIARVLDAIGDAPLEGYAAIADERLKRLTRRDTAQVFVHIAVDAQRAHREVAKLAKAAEPAPYDHTAWLDSMRAKCDADPGMRDDLRAIDPNLYFELFGSHAQGE